MLLQYITKLQKHPFGKPSSQKTPEDEGRELLPRAFINALRFYYNKRDENKMESEASWKLVLFGLKDTTLW